MKKTRLLWRLFPVLWLITILSLLFVTIYISHTFKEFYLAKAARDLQTRAVLIKNQVAGMLADGDYENINRLCKQLGDQAATRITLILP